MRKIFQTTAARLCGGLVFFAAIALAFAAGYCGEEYLADPDAEPSGFRGVAWQQSLDSAPDMVEIYREPDGSEITCRRKGEPLTFGEAKLSSVEYVFIDRKLSMVSVVVNGRREEDALLREALELFGRETLQRGGDYIWRFNDVAVMFSREPDEQSVLFYKYIGFLKDR
jgi:hypothetical protein